MLNSYCRALFQYINNLSIHTSHANTTGELLERKRTVHCVHACILRMYSVNILYAGILFWYSMHVFYACILRMYSINVLYAGILFWYSMHAFYACILRMYSINVLYAGILFWYSTYVFYAYVLSKYYIIFCAESNRMKFYREKILPRGTSTA